MTKKIILEKVNKLNESIKKTLLTERVYQIYDMQDILDLYYVYNGHTLVKIDDLEMTLDEFKTMYELGDYEIDEMLPVRI